MNDVMKKTAQTMLYAKGIRRTAVRLAIGLVMLGGVILGCAKENRGDGLLKTLKTGDASAVEKALSALTSEQLDGITKNKAAPGGDFTYELTDDGKGIVITEYTGPAVSVLVLPAEIEGYPVVKVGSGTGFLYNNLSLSNLEDGSENGIYEGREKDWRSLTSVVIPSTVTEISPRSFAASGLKNVVLPQGLKIIGESAFARADKIESLILPSNIEEIGYSAFYECTELFAITIPDSVKSLKIEDAAFKGCGKLPLATRQRLKDLGYTGKF